MEVVKNYEVAVSRDPDGFVVRINGQIMRAVKPAKTVQTRELLTAPWMATLMEDRHVPRTTESLAPREFVTDFNEWMWLRHEVVSFPCFPHEITALQLYDSGLLSLKLAIEAAKNGWIMKDASAWNVLHSEGRSVFVDFLSFEKEQFAGTWIAYGQFIRHFLLPLLLYKKLGLTPSDIFLINRDGVTPERAFALLRSSNMLSAETLELVLLPKWLSKSGAKLIATDSIRRRRALNPALGSQLFLHLLQRLQRLLERLKPRQPKSPSVWEHYEEDRSHYSAVDLVAKHAFVREGLEGSYSILDLGCNAGEFSFLASEYDRTVVAADFDHASVSRLYARIRQSGQRITPLVLNVANPTPAIGWRNHEIGSFLERSRGQFDIILLLGLIHHLLVSERITLIMLGELLDSFNSKAVILEWVDQTDPKFMQLAGLNQDLYRQLDSTQLEAYMGLRFNLTRKSRLRCGTRVMYLWNRK